MFVFYSSEGPEWRGVRGKTMNSLGGHSLLGLWIHSELRWECTATAETFWTVEGSAEAGSLPGQEVVQGGETGKAQPRRSCETGQ